jgi:hypothetical protein
MHVELQGGIEFKSVDVINFHSQTYLRILFGTWACTLSIFSHFRRQVRKSWLPKFRNVKRVFILLIVKIR